MTATSQRLWLDAIAFWSPDLPGWPMARAALRDEPVPAHVHHARPSPLLLGPNERRRAPDTVLLALEVAQAAVRQAGLAPAEVASVFTSTHGDLAIVDALCTTLAGQPELLSPMRFHHSVHNAASGYWAMASGCRRASSAVAHFGHAFATGWLEAASLCATDAEPVLLVGFDTGARGALASVNRSQGLLAVALVLAPRPGPATLAQVDWMLGIDPNHDSAPALRSSAARALAGNAMADALPLFEALAHLPVAGSPAAGAPDAGPLTLPLGPDLALKLSLQAWPSAPDAQPPAA
jgi:hypothetical protein